MTVLLALDGGGDRFAAALGVRGRVAARAVAVSPAAPASVVALPLIQNLLADNDVLLEHCDAFAFAAGPGKFSSLRLVCAIARTFAYAHAKPLVAVPTFAVLAEENTADGDAGARIKCALSAHRGHVYFAVCAKRGGIWRHAGMSVVAADAPPPARHVRLACGDGFVRYPQLLAGATLRRRAAASAGDAVVHVAAAMLAAGETVPPLLSEPLYGRRKVAQTSVERARQRRRGVNNA